MCIRDRVGRDRNHTHPIGAPIGYHRFAGPGVGYLKHTAQHHYGHKRERQRETELNIIALFSFLPAMNHPENDSQYIGLTVNSGVAQPPSVNPYLAGRRRRKPMPTTGELVEGILKGDVTMLSRAVTLVESRSHEHQALAQEVIEKCLPYSGNSRRIGITGVPGAGKSTSIDVFLSLIHI